MTVLARCLLVSSLFTAVAARAELTVPKVAAIPVLQPEKEVAIVRAMSTLHKAIAHLEQHASGERMISIGITAPTRKIETLRTRNVVAIAARRADGKSAQMFAVEVATSNRLDATWVPVPVTSDGVIKAPLFGAESILAKATGFSPETMNAARRADLAAAPPIDVASAEIAREQQKARLTAQP